MKLDKNDVRQALVDLAFTVLAFLLLAGCFLAAMRLSAGWQR